MEMEMDGNEVRLRDAIRHCEQQSGGWRMTEES